MITQASLLRVSLYATLGIFAVLIVLDAGLHTTAAVNGIVSYELAGSAAEKILRAWSEAQRRDALLLQGLDYAFLCAYATLFACAALDAGASTHNPRIARLAKPFAWVGGLAGVADAIENVPLILMLREGSANTVGASIAFVFASLKFSLITAVVLYLGVAWWLRREQAAKA